jgi:hypothetical protein
MTDIVFFFTDFLYANINNGNPNALDLVYQKRKNRQLNIRNIAVSINKETKFFFIDKVRFQKLNWSQNYCPCFQQTREKKQSFLKQRKCSNRSSKCFDITKRNQIKLFGRKT